MMFIRLCVLVIALMVGAQSRAEVLSGPASEPAQMGWMTGSPTPEALRIMQPFSDFWRFPKLRWSVCHLRELMPTKAVSRRHFGVTDLKKGNDDSLGELLVPYGPAGGSVPLSDWLPLTYTDGLLVLHEGAIAYEYYGGCLTRDIEHAMMSMTKSVVGLLAEILIAEGDLDDRALVTDWLPELADSAFAGATVRQVMDMTTGVAFDETYSDPNADIWRYARATNAMPKADGYDGPVGYFEFLQTLKELDFEHGSAFKYGTVNTDALGWIVERASGKPLATLASERLWRPLGAEQDAYFTIDGIGTAHPGGGMNAGLRDLGRLGLALANNGVVDGVSVIPPAALASIVPASQAVDSDAKATEGDNIIAAHAPLAAARITGERAEYWSHYRSMWWYPKGQPSVVAARGVHGQILLVDADADLVIVRLASHPVAGNSAIDPITLPVLEKIRQRLLEGE